MLNQLIQMMNHHLRYWSNGFPPLRADLGHHRARLFVVGLVFLAVTVLPFFFGDETAHSG